MATPVHFDPLAVEVSMREQLQIGLAQGRAQRAAQGKDTRYLHLQEMLMEVWIAGTVGMAKAHNAAFTPAEVAQGLGLAMGSVLAHFMRNFDRDGDLGDALFTAMLESAASVVAGEPVNDGIVLQGRIAGVKGGRA